MAKAVIRQVTDPADYARSVRVIRNSFITVARELNLTRENSPNHPAFFTVDRLKEMKSREAEFFGLFLEGKQTGFVAIEKADRLEFLSRYMQVDGSVYWIERLAVLPSYRNGGSGAQLVAFAIDRIRGKGGSKIALGMINEQTGLKNWYKKLGFREVHVEKFPNTPFTVCFMERDAQPLSKS